MEFNTLSRRRLLQAAGAAFVACGLANVAGAANAYGNTRYVAATGSDSNPGTEAAPWKSLSKVQSAISSGEIGRGDSVLLRRGDIFYGWFDSPSLTGTTGLFTLGAYTGSLGITTPPQINGYKISNDSWVQHSTGVWKLNLSANSGEYTGNTGQGSANVGYLMLPGGPNIQSIKGVKRWNLADLVNDWDFYNDTTYVYVKKATSPGAGVQIAVKQDAVNPSSNSIIRDLHIVGHGGHGVNNVSAKNTQILDNTIEWIGGSQLGSTNPTRYGNGVEIWIGANNVLVQGNTIRQTYDTATTMQGTASGSNIAFTDCRILSNKIDNCNQSFEIWNEGTGTTGYGHIRCQFNDNICRYAGQSWAANIRPDQSGTGTHLLVYQIQLPVDVEVTRNKFYGAKDNYARCSGDRQFPAGYNTHHNTISLDPGKKIAYLNSETIEQYEAWRTRTGKETGSTFYVGLGACKI